MLRGFKEFLIQGNVISITTAIIIGAAFNQVVNSLVADVITPIIGALGGNPDFSSIKLGPVWIGKFINAVLNFIIVSSAVYFIIVVPMQKLKERKREAEEEEKALPQEPHEEVKLLREILEELRKR